MMERNPEFLFNLGEKDGLVRFAYGQYQGTDWKVEKISASVNDLQLDPSALSALESSKALNTWVQIK